ncbi:hypothetical protein OKW35_000940 [Paraburkholderia sp. MM5477-R1]
MWLAFSIYQQLDGHAGFALKFAEFAECNTSATLTGVSRDMHHFDETQLTQFVRKVHATVRSS